MNTNLLSNVTNPMELAMLKGDGSSQLGQQFGKGFAEHASLNDYNDINALQSLKYKSGDDREAALDATAKHFESLFVSMMIKSMRDANKVFSEGNMLQSSQGDFYQQMFDSQLAVSLSTGKGIGLADVIKRQLAENQNLNQENVKPGIALQAKERFYSLDDYARMPSVTQEKVAQIEHVIGNIDEQLEKLKTGDKIESPADHAYDFSSPEQFIKSLYPHAKQVEAETGIDARLMLAQSALETGWGKHQIHHDNGAPSFNLFGIKSHRDWSGDEANILTTEYRNGIAMKEQASFRAYDSYQDSFRDYAAFLKSNNRYETALENADDPKVFAQELQSAGYATDPNYAQKINRILDRYMNLDAFESQGLSSDKVSHNEASLSVSTNESRVGG